MMPEVLLTLRKKPTQTLAEREFVFETKHFNELVPNGPPTDFLEQEFDSTLERIRSELGFSVEPDGSFGGAGQVDEKIWNIVGMLVDAGPQLAYIDLQGSAPGSIWRKVFEAIDLAIVESNSPQDSQQALTGEITSPSVGNAKKADRLNNYMVFLKESGRHLSVDEFVRLADLINAELP